MSIVVNKLLKLYGEQKAVNEISFRVEPGEIVGFLGPNGAGKSTTMKILTGYLQPDSGETLVSDINVQQQPLNAQRKIGYLPESNALYHDMYVREYLGFIAEIHGQKEIRKRIGEVIELTGLTRESKKKIGQLSKGYKQRVGLAASLIHDPEVLILDEPTSGLDPNQIVEIREVIRQQGKNKTVLFSSHILQEVEAICDRVIIINRGRLVADDTLASLRSGAGRHNLTVRFGENIDGALLRSLPAAAEVMQNAGGWQIQTDRPDDMRKQIMELALQHNLNIVSLQSENRSLEDVFRNLTSENAAD